MQIKQATSQSKLPLFAFCGEQCKQVVYHWKKGPDFLFCIESDGSYSVALDAILRAAMPKRGVRPFYIELRAHGS